MWQIVYSSRIFTFHVIELKARSRAFASDNLLFYLSYVENPVNLNQICVLHRNAVLKHHSVDIETTTLAISLGTLCSIASH